MTINRHLPPLSGSVPPCLPKHIFASYQPWMRFALSSPLGEAEPRSLYQQLHAEVLRAYRALELHMPLRAPCGRLQRDLLRLRACTQQTAVRFADDHTSLRGGGVEPLGRMIALVAGGLGALRALALAEPALQHACAQRLRDQAATPYPFTAHERRFQRMLRCYADGSLELPHTAHGRTTFEGFYRPLFASYAARGDRGLMVALWWLSRVEGAITAAWVIWGHPHAQAPSAPLREPPPGQPAQGHRPVARTTLAVAPRPAPTHPNSVGWSPRR